MINKNKFLARFHIDSSHNTHAINQLIFNWHEEEENGWMKKYPNGVKKEFEEGLTTAIQYWLYLLKAEAEGFHNKQHNKTFHKLLKRVILGGETISYFGVLCPAYKKGIDAVGFATQPGNTSFRAFHNILKMVEVTKLLKIKCNYQMFFANVSLERTERFSDNDWLDLDKIILMDGIIAKSLSVPYKTLTELDPKLKSKIGPDGKIVDISKLPIDAGALERAMWRDRQFYPRMFGWSIEEAEKRTKCHAHSYYWQSETIRKHLKNPVMVYSAYDYEKGGLYNGPDGTYEPCIIYPLKDSTNPPNATLPDLKQ